MAIFWASKSLKLLSRKIWVAEKSWNFCIVYFQIRLDRSVVVQTLIFASQFQSHGGANSYGYAYGSSSRGSNRNQYRQRQNEAEDDSQLKKLIREIRSSINETREFWTKLPYVLCKEDATEAAKLRGGFARSRYERQFYKVSFWTLDYTKKILFYKSFSRKKKYFTINSQCGNFLGFWKCKMYHQSTLSRSEFSFS